MSNNELLELPRVAAKNIVGGAGALALGAAERIAPSGLSEHIPDVPLRWLKGVKVEHNSRHMLSITADESAGSTPRSRQTIASLAVKGYDIDRIKNDPEATLGLVTIKPDGEEMVAPLPVGVELAEDDSGRFVAGVRTPNQDIEMAFCEIRHDGAQAIQTTSAFGIGYITYTQMMRDQAQHHSGYPHNAPLFNAP